MRTLIMLLAAASLAADSGDTGSISSTTLPLEDACQAIWQLSVDNAIQLDSAVVEPCGIWDPATSVDPNTGLCQFFCGDDDHFTFVGSIE